MARRGVGEAVPFTFGRGLLVDGPELGALGDGAGDGEFSDARGDLDIDSTRNEVVEKKMQSRISLSMLEPRWSSRMIYESREKYGAILRLKRLHNKNDPVRVQRAHSIITISAQESKQGSLHDHTNQQASQEENKDKKKTHSSSFRFPAKSRP